VTEADWVAGRSFDAMLRFLHYARCARQGRATDPKVRLLACLACVPVEHLLHHEGSRSAYQVVRGYALGHAGVAELTEVVTPAEAGMTAAQESWWDARGDDERDRARAAAWAAEAVFLAAGGRPTGSGLRSATAGRVLGSVEAALACEAGPRGRVVVDDERRRQRGLFHELFGNPFKPVAFNPDWKTSSALSIARMMYDSNDFASAPVLADALQDGGCESDGLLGHLRGPGPHVRGCWVCDLVLGKD
jgi:hypothetical protein